MGDNSIVKTIIVLLVLIALGAFYILSMYVAYTSGTQAECKENFNNNYLLDDNYVSYKGNYPANWKYMTKYEPRTNIMDGLTTDSNPYVILN